MGMTEQALGREAFEKVTEYIDNIASSPSIRSITSSAKYLNYSEEARNCRKLNAISDSTYR